MLSVVDHSTFDFAREMYGEMLPWSVASLPKHVDVDACLQDEKSHWWTFELSKNELVGLCGLQGVNPIDRTAEPAIAIHPAYRNATHGLKMSRLLIETAWKRLNLRRLHVIVLKDAPSVPLLKRTGFKCEGTFEKVRYRDGEYVDACMYALMRGE